MDIAEQLVVMNEGRVEQIGSADDLYERPANEFVMGFVGEINRFGSKLVRPEDLEILLQPDLGSIPATIERIVRLGFEARIELSLGDGSDAWAQLTRAEIEELDLQRGQSVSLRPRRTADFGDRITEVSTG